MVKQWKKSLEQTDIVSDGTPFDGANIDAPISEAGQGVDWASKTPKYTFGATLDSNTDVVSVTGSGYLATLWFNASSYDDQIRLEIDGTELFLSDASELSVSEQPFKATIPLFYRFDNSLTIGSGTIGSQTEFSAYYVLD